MNCFKKIWYGTIRKSTYDLFALIEHKKVVELIYWNRDYEKLQLNPNQSLLLITPELNLVVGSEWNGQRWVNPEG